MKNFDAPDAAKNAPNRIKRNTNDAPSKLSRTQVAASLTEFGHHQGLNLVQDRWIRIPSFDDWTPDLIPRDTATIFTALLKVTGEENQLLFNLRDLGTFNISKNVLDFIEKEDYENITKIYESFFYIHLYSGEEMKEGDSLRCDKDLNIYATRPLDPRKMNRVRFSMMVDINLLSFEVRDRLWGDKDCLKSVICTINEKVRDHSDFFVGKIQYLRCAGYFDKTDNIVCDNLFWTDDMINRKTVAPSQFWVQIV